MERVIGRRYVVHDVLGAGSMGIVYRATDRLTGQVVALKQVTAVDAGSTLHLAEQQGDLRLALAQEFRVLAGLRHPNIISVLDHGFDADGQPYYTMNLLEDARTVLEAGCAKPLSFRVNLLVQALQALDYLHRWHILHRDIKPENILVTGGQVKLLDFGLALHREQVRPNQVAGTLMYIAPEVLQGMPAVEQSDLYAIGVIAYELLTGRPLYDDKSVSSLIYRVVAQPADFSSVQLDPALIAVLDRLLAKRPEERYPSASAALRALQAAVGESIPLESTAVRESFLQAAPFVGREAELALLTSALDDALGGHGSAWLVGGESGVGKSRLIDELRTAALVRGAQVITGQAVHEGGEPYAPWRSILRRLVLLVDVSIEDAAVLRDLVPDIGDLLGRSVPPSVAVEARLAQTRLLGVLSSLLRRLSEPVVLIVEDAHWAGSETFALLRQASQLVPELRLLVIATFRDDERPDLPKLLPDFELVRLSRLSADEVARLSEAMLGENGRQPAVVDLLMRESEGNIFFLVEVVRALAEEAGHLQMVGTKTLPDHVFTGGVQQLVLRRLARVPNRWHGLLQAAAAVGRQIDLALMGIISPGVDLDRWLIDCASAAVLEVHDGAWRFTHDKLREGILAVMPPTARRSLHLRVAQAIQRLYGDSQAAALAYHYDQAGQTYEAVYYTGLAGYVMLQASVYDQALIYFERALTLLGKPMTRREQEQVALLRLNAGYACWGVSQYDCAEQFFQLSLVVAQEIGDRLTMAEAIRGLGDVARRRGHYREARAHFETCLTLCRETASQTAVAQALARVAVILRIEGDYAGAQRYYQESLAIYEALGQTEHVATIKNGLGLIASDLGDYALAREYVSGSLAIARQLNDAIGVALMLTALAWINYLSGDYPAAQSHSQESLAICRELGDRWMIANNLGNLGKIAVKIGDYAEAWRCFVEALATSDAIGSIPLTLEILPGVADLYRRLDMPERAVELLGLALSHPASYSEVQVQAEPLLAELHAALDPDALDAALARGCSLDLNRVVSEIVGHEH